MKMILAVALGVAIAFLLAVGFPSHGAGQGTGQMQNCPAAGKWSIAVWSGDSGAAPGQALAACGAGAVAAAYSLDAQTQAWSRWFADKPEVSNLAPLNDRQGVLALGGAAAAAGAGPLAAAQAANQMQNCPAAGKWSIAVWDGDSGATAAEALATCGAGAVAAAYSLDAQTQAWSRWFADKPEVSNLAPLNDKQGVLALGAGGEAPPPAAGPEAELAAQLYAATDTDAAAIPMLQVYDYLGAGLYTVDGQPIQAGAETGPDDFRLYDFESGIMLQAYIQRQRFPVDRLATFLGQAGVVNQETGQPFTGSEWLAVLSEAVSRGRADDSAFTVRLIDALGLVRSTPLDLTASGLDPASTYLDAVQTFLILYDVLFGLPAEAGTASADSAAHLDTIELAGIVRKAGQIAIRVGGKIGRSSYPAAIAKIINDALLAYGFIITLEPYDDETHWFPCQGEPEGSGEVTLKAKVVWDVGKFNDAVRNANLMGFQWLPVPGVQDDIRVSWTAADVLIPKNGSWKQTANSGMTDDNGETSIIFVPKTEARPGAGIKTEDPPGVFEARIQIRSWYNPLVVWDLIGLGPETNYVFGALRVWRHQQWKLEMEGSWTAIYGACSDAQGRNDDFSYRVDIPKTSIPLRKAPDGTQLEGDATVNADFTNPPCNPPGLICQVLPAQGAFPLHIDVTATGQNPLSFFVVFRGYQPSEMKCESDLDRWTTPRPDWSYGVTLGPFSLPAEDGATSTPPPTRHVGTASVTFTLREE